MDSLLSATVLLTCTPTASHTISIARSVGLTGDVHRAGAYCPREHRRMASAVNMQDESAGGETMYVWGVQRAIPAARACELRASHTRAYGHSGTTTATVAATATEL